MQERHAELCTPAVVVNGMFLRRVLISSTAGAPIWSSSFKSSPPPISSSKNFLPSSSRDQRVHVLLVEPQRPVDEVADIEQVLAVAREIVLDDARRRACRAAGLRREIVARARCPRRVRHADRAAAAGLPTACALNVRAALRYCSMNDGETWSALAMLSKPSSGPPRATGSAGPRRARAGPGSRLRTRSG